MATGAQNPVTIVAPASDGWTVETYAIHNEAIRATEALFMEERDRRYAEVATEREKALKIKETADLAALGLAREIQSYKDEKANHLRSQIESERGTYATKDDVAGAVGKIEATIGPLITYIAGQQGRTESSIENRSRSQWTIQQVLTILAVGLGGLYFLITQVRMVPPS